MVSQRIVEVLIQKQQHALDCGNPPFAAVIECDGEILISHRIYLYFLHILSISDSSNRNSNKTIF